MNGTSEEKTAEERASRGPYIVEYPNGHFGYSEGGYKPYRRKNAKETAARWRKNNSPERAAEYKRRYRKGDRRDEFRAAPVDSAASGCSLGIQAERIRLCLFRLPTADKKKNHPSRL